VIDLEVNVSLWKSLIKLKSIEKSPTKKDFIHCKFFRNSIAVWIVSCHKRFLMFLKMQSASQVATTVKALAMAGNL